MLRSALLVMVMSSFPIAVGAQTAQPSPAAAIALEAPPWLKEFRFPQAKFTLARVEYESVGRPSSWSTDYPDADLNLVAQLGRLTKLDVSKPTCVLKLIDPGLADYPVLYLAEPGSLSFHEAEITALRKYLDAGGFLLMDDFWGEAEWENVRTQLKRVLPDREPTDLPLSHPLFHCVFDLNEKPQVVSIHAFLAGEKTERADARQPHYRAIQDRRGRMVVLSCHNTDLGDGWERVGADAAYTREMSVAKAFPMGINILYYALTQPKRSE